MIKASHSPHPLPDIPWPAEIYGIEVVELPPEFGWAQWDQVQRELDMRGAYDWN